MWSEGRCGPIKNNDVSWPGLSRPSRLEGDDLKEYYVYILASRPGGALYVGGTNDFPRRVAQHKQGLVQGHTKRYGINKLVHFEQYADVRDAIQRE
jgi:hypothetical protein